MLPPHFHALLIRLDDKVTTPNCLGSSSNPRTRIVRKLGKFLTAFVVGAVLTSALMGQASAHGWGGPGWGGVGIGFGFAPFAPYYYPPPVYYAPPPVYYPPPPGYYSPYPGYSAQAPASPPQGAHTGSNAPAQSCNAGSYVCPWRSTCPSAPTAIAAAIMAIASMAPLSRPDPVAITECESPGRL